MSPRPKDIFLDALEIDDADERRAFVERLCGADAALRESVEALLDAHASAATLRPPARAIGSSLSNASSRSDGVYAATDKPGDVISNRYELIRTLGEGGFGVVYLARQREPVVRDVAIKLLKCGVDGGQIVTRFEAERQTLARMDHPQIARVFDAGTSERGRPYFVMEYVDGQPITTHCNANALGLVARLRLLEQVCIAVQHAHQKGVIHRDLKPGNILVALVDGTPTPKVIDFGIAKAINTDDDDLAAEQPSMTLEAQIIGTPQYMAPEQAIIGPKNVDTRSDVYSLGTVMYELITGSPPFDPTELRRVGLEQVCRIVRERTPARPSTRISAAVDADQLEAWKGFDTSRLSRQVAGEIDWIVMKALEKEPSRRYQTASDLAADIRRHLNHEPVTAGPPSRVYAFRKFVRRHRIEVAAALAVMTALLATAVISAVKESQARIAKTAAVASEGLARAAERKARESEAEAIAKAEEAARELAKANAIATFTERMLRGIAPSIARGRDTTLLKDLLDGAVDRVDDAVAHAPTIELTVRAMIGKAQFDLGDYDRAIATLRPTFERTRDSTDRNSPERLRAGTQLGTILVESNRAADATAVLRETVDGYAQRGEASSTDALAARVALGSALMHSRIYDDAFRVEQTVLAELQQSGRGESELALLVSNSIATLLRSTGQVDSAVQRWDALLATQRRVLGDDHPGTLATMSNLAYAYHEMRRYDDAERLDRQILALERALYEPGHPNLVKTLNNLGALLLTLDRLPEAETYLVEAEQIARAKLEPTHRYAMAVDVQMMNLRSNQGRFDDAAQIAMRIRDAYASKYGNADVRTAAAQTVLIGCLADAKRLDEALRLIETLGSDPLPPSLAAEQRATFYAAVADVLLGAGRRDEAQRAAATARSFITDPPDGSRARVGTRLLRVEASLAISGATTQPSTAPDSRADPVEIQ